MIHFTFDHFLLVLTNWLSKMKKSAMDTAGKGEEVDEDHLKIVRFYREKMDLQPIHSALRSFNVQDGARMSGVYEIYRNNEVRNKSSDAPVEKVAKNGRCVSL